MKKVWKWLGRAATALFISILLAPAVLGLLAFLFVFIIFTFFDSELDMRNEIAVQAMETVGLTEYVDYVPHHAMTLDNLFAAFVMPKYDNHVDNTPLWERIMDCAAVNEDWHIDSITAESYIQQLRMVVPELTFLLPPADLTFDAWYHDESARLAFFDQDTGLMVYLCPSASPASGKVDAYELSLPNNGYVYEMETHGGFHGDGITFRALIVPEHARPALEAKLSCHADWHSGSISCAEYGRLHECFYEIPPFYPASDLTFDWWCWVDTYARQYPDKNKSVRDSEIFPRVMQEVGAGRSSNWLVALYDVDTGLFIYYEYDS